MKTRINQIMIILGLLSLVAHIAFYSSASQACTPPLPIQSCSEAFTQLGTLKKEITTIESKMGIIKENLKTTRDLWKCRQATVGARSCMDNVKTQHTFSEADLATEYAASCGQNPEVRARYFCSEVHASNILSRKIENKRACFYFSDLKILKLEKVQKANQLTAFISKNCRN